MPNPEPFSMTTYSIKRNIGDPNPATLGVRQTTIFLTATGLYSIVSFMRFPPTPRQASIAIQQAFNQAEFFEGGI